MKASAALAARLSTAAAIAVSGYIHADLYLNGGYRHIHIIGTAFLLQAGGAFAVTLLLLVSDSAICCSRPGSWPCASRRRASRVPNNHPYWSRRMSILVARAAVDLATGCQGRVNWYPARVSGTE
jgi:hypothetical protein